MSIYELARKYINGLISKEELQKAIDIDNMGSDTRFLTIEDVVNAVK